MEDDGGVGTEAASSGGAPAVVPSGWTPSTGVSSLAAASLVLLLLYLTGRFLWLYSKDAAAAAASPSSSSSSRRRRRPAAAAADPPTSSSLSPPGGGRAVPLLPPPPSSSSSPPPSLLSIPVFFVMYVAPPGPGETAECAVCLAEFREREAGRLLPRCGHAFHEECIATWLRASATCPLCRAPVVTK